MVQVSRFIIKYGYYSILEEVDRSSAFARVYFPMSDTPRNMVNILSVCEANLADAFAKNKAAKKARKEAEDQVSAIKSRHQAEMDAANLELSKIATLIQDNEREGVPTEKLEMKSSDIKARIKKLEVGHADSEELTVSLAAVDKAVADLESAEELHEKCKAREAVARSLKVAFDIDNSCGAIEAPEYETLEEAVSEYISSMPVLVGVSKDLTIDRLCLWQVPNADKPICAALSATAGKLFRLNQMPDSLAWLKEFQKSPYSNMTTGNRGNFSAEGIPFQMLSCEASSEDKDMKETAWMGTMESYFNRDGHYKSPGAVDIPGNSLFAPAGIRGTYSRSGLCYVKSESRFYSLRPKEFAGSKLVPGRVKKVRNGYVYEEDGQVPEDCEIDASALLHSFFGPVYDAIQALLPEFKELQSSKSPLAIRVANAVKTVGVLESTFEQCTKRLTGTEVTAEVGAYWDAFVSAPWEGIVSGDVAMLKHLCERKLESPHVWSHSIKGFYGLRVRTRDHDWITAYIYCPPSHFSPQNPVSHDEVFYYRNGDYGCNAHVRVGPCYIKVRGRQK